MISGCPFSDRCPDVKPCCSETMPEKRDLGQAHLVTCWNYL
jgi:ABC-type dipeptide/oligopeptide/nickel transport system ATPase component